MGGSTQTLLGISLASESPCARIGGMSISPDEFRKTLAKFASGVTVVTSSDAEGGIFGITVSAFCSVSLEPPLILVSIEKETGTHHALSEGDAFNVHILSEDQQDVSNRFASRSENKFDGFDFSLDDRGIPKMGDSLAMMKCRKFSEADGGDHTIFVGEVLETEIRDGFPLLYWQSAYRKIEK